MKKYFAPELELLHVGTADIITASGYPANSLGGNDPYMSDLGNSWMIS